MGILWNEVRAEFAVRINKAIGMMRKMVRRGITLKDLDEIEKILLNTQDAG